jgi:hypothetical protein
VPDTTVRPVRATRRLRTGAGVALAGVVLAGCAQEVAQQAAALSPAARVDTAVSTVLDTERLTVAVGLDLDDADRDALTALAADSGLSPAAAERVLGLRVVSTLVADQGVLSDVQWSQDPTAVPPVSASVALEVEGPALAEVRTVDGAVYARADVAAIETAFEQEGLADEMTLGLEGAPPQLAEAATALTAGEWVSIDAAALTEQLSELSAALTPQPTPSPDTTRAAAAVDDFLSEAAAVLRREVVVEELAADRYEVTAPLDKVLTSLTPSITTLVGELVTGGAVPSGAVDEDVDAALAQITADVQEELESLQDELAGRTASVEVGLDGDRLGSVRLDLVQLVDEETREEIVQDGVSALPVLITFAAEGEVEAPQGATALDVAGLLDDALGAGPAGLLGGGVPGTDPFAGVSAADLGMTEEEFEAFRAELGVVTSP